MKRTSQRLFALACLASLGLNSFALPAHAQGHSGHDHAAGGEVPAYNALPPRKGAQLRPILSGSALNSSSFQYMFQKVSYQMAQKIHAILFQLPCYCYCDRSAGHNSLRSCFEDEHAAHCEACMAEAFFAYQQTKLGKTPKQIREAIVKGDWRNINLEKAAAEFQDDQAKAAKRAQKKN